MKRADVTMWVRFACASVYNLCCIPDVGIGEELDARSTGVMSAYSQHHRVQLSHPMYSDMVRGQSIRSKYTQQAVKDQAG